MDIGMIGFGQVGAEVFDGIASGRAGDVRVTGVLVRRGGVERGSPAAAAVVTTDVAAFLAQPHDLVVEVGGHGALREHGEAVLAAGSDLLTISVGAFADGDLHERLRAAAERTGRQVLIPSGAIAGLDAIGAAALGDLDSVVHTTRKPVGAFTAEQLGGPPPEDEARLLFDGPASEGVLLYPENVNVAAAVSLAGIGLARTRLRVYADPTISRNQHEVVAEGYFGRLRIEIENVPTSNPKTGRIVALSVLKAIRDRSAPIVLGR